MMEEAGLTFPIAAAMVEGIDCDWCQIRLRGHDLVACVQPSALQAGLPARTVPNY
jgi:hypothetical protein